MSEAGFDPDSESEAFGLRIGSLPCELRLVARPTVAHTGGYLLFLPVRLLARVPCGLLAACGLADWELDAAA
jgi:hypothetical protein